MLLRSVVLTVFVLAVFTLDGHADSWAAPTPRIFANAWGSHGLKVLPNREKLYDGPAEAILFTLDGTGAEQVVFQTRLVNLPHRVFLSSTGKNLVTVDTYGSLGYRHSVVLYGEKGQRLADYALEDLLTVTEVTDRVQKTTSSRHWTSGARFSFSEEGNTFDIALKWGRTLKFDLATGKIR